MKEIFATIIMGAVGVMLFPLLIYYIFILPPILFYQIGVVGFSLSEVLQHSFLPL